MQSSQQCHLTLLGPMSVKAVCRTLMKLRSRLDFINVLCTAFALVDSESVRTQSSCQYHLTLLGPMSVKAVCRTLMKFRSVLFLRKKILSFSKQICLPFVLPDNHAPGAVQKCL